MRTIEDRLSSLEELAEVTDKLNTSTKSTFLRAVAEMMGAAGQSNSGTQVAADQTQQFLAADLPA